MVWFDLVLEFLFKVLLLLGAVAGIVVLIAIIVGVVRWIFTGDFEGY